MAQLPNRHRWAALLNYACVLLGFWAVAGCASSGSGPGERKARPFLDPYPAQKDLAEARRLMQDGRHHEVPPRLGRLIAQYPNTTTATEAYYLLGVAYFELNGYRNALDAFQEYLKRAPDGPHAQESRDKIAQLAALSEERYSTPDTLDAEIAAIESELRKGVESPELLLALGDRLWRRGRYEDAGKAYMRLIRVAPEFARSETLYARVEIQEDGSYVVLTPDEIRRREIERNPLGIINVHGFRTGRDLFTREFRDYVVSGQAVNRGGRILENVEILGTVYGFGGVVLDTRTVRVGRLRPGETRPFSMRFSNFESLNSIERYELVGIYD